MRAPAALVLAAAASLWGCEAAPAKLGGGASETGCTSDTACPSDQQCVSGKCQKPRVLGLFDASGGDPGSLFDDAAGGDGASAIGVDGAGNPGSNSDSDAAIDASPADSLDAGATVDAGVAQDAAMPTDIAASPDIAAQPEIATSPDIAASPDVAVAADATAPVTCAKDKDCVPVLACTTGECIGGKCSYEVKPSHCLIDNTCVAAKTAGPKPCDVCAPLFSQSKWSVVDGAACDDGDPCTSADACDAKGACAGLAKSCKDDDPCTTDSCGKAGCEHAPVAGCCSKGECCDTTQFKPKPATTKCGAVVVATEFKCVGLEVHKREAVAGCSGNDGVCGVDPSSYHWGSWAKHSACTALTTCTSDGKTFSCSGAPAKGVDLVITALTTDKASYSAAEKVVATMTIKNHGQQDASTFKVEFRLSQDAKVSLGDKLLYTAYVPALKAGADTSVKRTLTLPDGTKGSWHVAGIADAGGAVSEANEDNNTKTAPFTVQ